MKVSVNEQKENVCMVTGATSGIGLATAQALAQKGKRVVLIGRDPGKCATTVTRIKQETGNPSVTFILADLSVQAQVYALAEEYKRRYSRLDVLVNNAGGFFTKRRLTDDGIEMTFALNYLSMFLLSNLLLDNLEASAPARIVNVSSEGHRTARLDFDNLYGELRYQGMQAYGQAKLAVVLFTYELARRLEGTQVTVNALHPGFVATNIGKNDGWRSRIFALVMKLFAVSPEEGAETSIYLAASNEISGETGKYFIKKTEVASAPATYDQATARQLWDISVQMTGL